MRSTSKLPALKIYSERKRPGIYASDEANLERRRENHGLKAMGIYTLVVLATACFVVFYFLAQRDNRVQSKARLESQENRFHLQFNISPEDEESFQKLLENSLLPQDLKNGFYFELDATSSAALAFESPVEANLTVTPKSLMVEGVLRTIWPKPSQDANCRIPQNSPISVYGTNLINILPKVISLPDELSEWTTSNFHTKDSQCLVLINGTDDFIILIKNSQINLESLKDLAISQKENVYKKELRDQVELHFLKLQEEGVEGEETTLVFFKTGDFIALSTSIETVDEFIKQDKKGDLITFPQKSTQGSPIFQASFQNYSDSYGQEKLLSFFFKNQNDLKKFQTTVKNADFTLTTDRFSALINLK